MPDPTAPALRYRITPVDPAAHLFEIELVVQDPDPQGQRLALPAWIPGSYMIREFARHVVAIEARGARRRLAIEKIDKHTWRAAPTTGALTVRYRVYAWDLSVRGAHLDTTHGFYNGTSVFLRVLGREDRACEVLIAPPPGAAASDWRVATTLPAARGRDGARAWGFGWHRADSYDALIDHPVEMGRFDVVTFEAGGVRHDVAITGVHDTDGARLAKDLAPVCEAQVALFEPREARAPFERYLFLVTAVGEGYGGLEHRDSTALLCARNDLPHAGLEKVTNGYRTFLGLASHEYFHSWHVKRIKPQAFAHYDLDRENYTRLLWVFEGYTSYYDDLMLARARVLEPASYLEALAGTVSAVLRSPSRLHQSIAESSFDAWIKYYRQDENAPNAVVSYYAKGALVALAIDLTVRARTGGRRSLDDLMRLLWRRYGRDFSREGSGVPEDALPALLKEATGVDLADSIARWAYGTEELPLAALLARVGVKLQANTSDRTPSLGARWAMRGHELTLTAVIHGGPAHAAGLSAGDVIVAADGVRVDDKSFKALLARRRERARLTLHVFRRDELREHVVRLGAPEPSEWKLTLAPKASHAALALRRGWLGTRA